MNESCRKPHLYNVGFIIKNTDQNKTLSKECNLLTQYEILSKCDVRTILKARTKRLLVALHAKKVQNITLHMISSLQGGRKERNS